jgi:AcrR family transcriptional regulator
MTAKAATAAVPAKADPSANVDARMVRTRAALRAALLSLVERKPFDQITIRDIVAEAGIGYATFFRHHPTKAALLEEVAADEIERLVSLSHPVLGEKGSFASSVTLCTYVSEHRALWSSLLTGGAAGVVREEFIKVALGIAPSLPAGGGWLPTELGAVFGVTATVEILAWWLRQPEFPVEKVAECLDRLVMAPTIGAD